MDDEKANLLVLNGILNHDYTLYMARNGLEGIERANAHIPDLILLDIGFTVNTQLKSLEATDDGPFVLDGKTVLVVDDVEIKKYLLQKNILQDGV